MKILMIGAGRDVQGGVATVVNQYYEGGLDCQVDLRYLASMKDGTRIKKLAVAIIAYLKFCALIRRFDIVHVHMSSRASFYRKSRFIMKAKKEHKKIIIHMHGSEFDVFYDRECNDNQKEYVKYIFGMADAVIALSEHWREYLSKITDRSRIVVIYNALTLPKFERRDYSDKNILFLGQLGKRKGVYDLLEAIPLIIRENPEAHFYFGGDGEIDKCRQICKERNLEKYVTFCGWITGEQKEGYLKKCSTFILPSYHEGMPMSLLEAMSYGDVVISTNVGGIPRVIDNKVNGYIVTPGAVAEIAKCVLEALTVENRESIGLTAYQTIERNFNIKNNIKNLIELYSSLISSKE